jgi:hypothetical protein
MNSTENKYAEEVFQALNEARESICKATSDAMSSEVSAVIAREFSKHDLLVAYGELINNGSLKNINSLIYQEATRANSIVGNIAVCSEAANAASLEATKMIGAVGNAVKECDKAIELLVTSTIGIASLAEQNDAGEELAKSGRAVGAAVNKLKESINETKSRAIDANIEAVQSFTAPLVSMLTTANKKISGMCTSALLEVSADTTEAKSLVDSILQNSKTYYSAILNASSWELKAANDSLLAIDLELKERLIVSSVWEIESFKISTNTLPPISLEKDSSIRFGIQVELPDLNDLPGDHISYKIMTVKEAAQDLITKPKANLKGAVPLSAYHSKVAKLWSDFEGKPIEYGPAYVVYLIQETRDRMETIIDISPPSSPIRSQYKPSLDAPGVIQIDKNNFIVYIEKKQITELPLNLEKKSLNLIVIPSSIKEQGDVLSSDQLKRLIPEHNKQPKPSKASDYSWISKSSSVETTSFKLDESIPEGFKNAAALIEMMKKTVPESNYKFDTLISLTEQKVKNMADPSKYLFFIFGWQIDSEASNSAYGKNSCLVAAEYIDLFGYEVDTPAMNYEITYCVNWELASSAGSVYSEAAILV